MSRVVINLVNNAMDAVLAGKKRKKSFQPSVWVSTRDRGDQVEILVKDNGEGIPAKHIEDVFKPFYTTKHGSRGNAGLGLSITYDIVVEEHGGALNVESEEGKYTIFTVMIPRKTSADSQDTPPLEQAQGNQSASG